MIIDNVAGLQYLLNEDIYLLPQDMNNLNAVAAEPVVIAESTPVKPEPVVEQTIVAEPAALYFNHLGNNAQQFLILCHYPGSDQMDEKHLEALKSALSRKQLALDDVAILNLHKHTAANVADLQQYFAPTRLLLLGATALLTGWDKFNFNQLTNLGSTKALYTYSFTEMMGDRDKTKAFWEQMKVL
jgi:hypothetical protein